MQLATHTVADTVAETRPAGQRWQAWLQAAVCVLLLHAMVLLAWSAMEAPPSVRSVAPALQVRPLTLGLQLATPSAPSPPVLQKATQKSPQPAPQQAAQQAAQPPRVVQATRPVAVSSAAPQAAHAAQSASSVPMPPAEPVPAALLAGSEPPDDEPASKPYATRLPPPFRWQYSLQRGGREGRSEIVFETDGSAYRMAWSNRQPGRDEHGLSSHGTIDEAGLAPERFADRRRGRERQAANFDRAAARITYSGPQVEHPLLPGAQDRLSWLVQLAAIVHADPARHAVPGARLRLPVTGARGESGYWSFVVQGRERTELPAGTVPDALYLVREPRRPYDVRVEVWLDPARHHLPVRLRLAPQPAGELLELRLESASE